MPPIWNTTLRKPRSSGLRPIRSPRGAVISRSPTTPMAATRLGWTPWRTRSRTRSASTPRAIRTRRFSDIPRPRHRSHHRHRIPFRLDAGLSFRRGLPDAAVLLRFRGRPRLQRRRLQEPEGSIRNLRMPSPRPTRANVPPPCRKLRRPCSRILPSIPLCVR